jgi:site-specific DNA-methyltransferase (adenine-specific)
MIKNVFVGVTCWGTIKMNLPNKKYNIIYADPPWSYGDKLKHWGGGANSHYDTMKLSEIKEMNISEISEKNCILFLWATFPNLQEGLDVIKSWGFEYKTLGFSWIKTNKRNKKPFFGIGHYTKSNCEVCLIGVKGKPKIIDNSISSVLISPRENHSKKPDIVKKKIVSLCGDLPRIELFARNNTPGWDSWGNDPKLENKPLEVFA